MIRWLNNVITSGASIGIDAEFKVESMADLNELVPHQVGSISGVKSVEITVTLDFVKRRYNWGTGFDH